MQFYDKIASISLNQFNELPKTGKPNQNQWTILCTIIKDNANKLEVVSLGTGSKCIGKNKMSPLGDILNDSHAEIICRRSFLLYLYAEINLASNHKSEIFNYDENSNKFTLKDGITFHFFTTHVPCGDAAIFPKNTEDVGTSITESTADEDEIPTKKIKLDQSSDINRTGAKCLEGSEVQDPHLAGPEYHKVSVIRTKPGRGDPTLSVSCSDKIAKWCYLGVQGALLTLLVDKPIYLQSITLSNGTDFSKESLNRALNTRFNQFSYLSYLKHDMEIYLASAEFPYSKSDAKQPCPSSIVWYKHSTKVEVAVEGIKQGITKKKIGTRAARLQICKMELFRTFCDIAKLVNLGNFENLSYQDSKSSAKNYQDSWKRLKEDIFKVWTVKDLTLLQFHLDSVD